MDGNQWCATRMDFDNLEELPAGFGSTVWRAIGELAKELGYQPRKIWATTIADLVGPKTRYDIE